MADSESALIDAARSLMPWVSEHAAQAERERKLPQRLVDEFSSAGLFKMSVPKSLGGLEADPLTLLKVIELIASADGSAGWCVDLNAACGFFSGFLPESGARAVFADPNRAVGGIINPTGRATLVEGGYRVNGRWTFASTCNHAAWMGTSCLVFDGDELRMNGSAPEIVIAFVANSDFKIIDTWHASGLRGTGSHDIEVSDVFVPTERVFKMLPEPVHAGSLYKFPFLGFFAAANAAVALGVARGALDEILRVAREKMPFGSMTTLAYRPTAQTAVGRAEGLVRSARAFLFESTEGIWRRIVANEPLSIEEKALYRVASATACRQAAEAVDLAYTTGGGSALYEKSPLQRYFRDVHAITQHAAVAAPMFEMAGAALLGAGEAHPLL